MKDPVLWKVGNFGLWQMRGVAIMAISGILSAWQVLAIGFMIPDVEYWCSSQPSTPTIFENTTDECKFTIETTDGYFSESDCTDWTYETNNSLVTEFNLVCSNDYLRSVSQSVYMSGVMIGAILSGFLSDKFGRKRVSLVFSVVLTIFGCCSAASDSMLTYIILRWFIAVSALSTYSVSYVYCMEMVGGVWTTIVGIGFQYWWALGYITLPGLAWILPYWAHLQLVISVPTVVYTCLLLYPGLVPESPRWLLVNGREKEALKILEQAAELNSMSVTATADPPVEAPEKTEKTEEEKNTGQLRELLHSPHTLICTLVLYFLWFSNSFVYYGLTLNSGSLFPGSIYVNNAISGALEFLAYTITILIVLFGGRRFTLAAMMAFCGLCLLLTLSTSSETGILVLAQLGKLAITCSFAMVYQYSAEIYPTVIRNFGLGSSSFCARIGSIVAPYIGRELGRLSPTAPIVIFGVTSLIAGALTLVLPETKGTKIPDTVQEGEVLLASNPGMFRFCWGKPKSVS